MSDSRNNARETPIERPTWRFSGRRGTPVHLRDQASPALPKEIRDALVEMTRERRSEPGEAPSTASQHPASPVAAAPVPVERRAPRGPAPDAVAASPIATPAQDAQPPASPTGTAGPSTKRKRKRKAKKSRASKPSAATEKPSQRTIAADRIVPATEAASIERPAQLERPASPETLEPLEVQQQATDRPEPSIATESGRQAAWELGRLPFLIRAEALPDASPEPAQPEALAIPPARELKPAPAQSVPDSLQLQPIDWIPLGNDPVPAPIDPIEDVPSRTPSAIQRLSHGISGDPGDFAPVRARERAENYLDLDAAPGEEAQPPPALHVPAPAARAAEARHRLARSRRKLDEVVERLAAASDDAGRTTHTHR